jgi:hypothetical protein
MIALVEKLAGQGTATREAARRETAKPKTAGRRNTSSSRSSLPRSPSTCASASRRRGVEKDEIITALENIIKELRASR